jgi:hypothetical protein
MTVEHLSFKIIPRPVGICSPHTHLVVSGRGVPHEPLTLFYEELQKSCTPGRLHAIMVSLLSFFSFLEEPLRPRDVRLPRTHEEWSYCKVAMEVPSLPASMAWAAPPSVLQAAVRYYLAAHWGCRTSQQGEHEDIRLSPFKEGEQELHVFLAALQRFYRFPMERRDYWYERNPAEAFRLPLRSRLLQAIAPGRFSLRSRPARNQRIVGVVIGERLVQTAREPRDKVLD